MGVGRVTPRGRRGEVDNAGRARPKAAWTTVIGSLFFGAPGLTAQQAETPTEPAVPPLELTRLIAPIELDGRPDEAAWQTVPTLPLTMYYPTFGGVPTERSVVRVAYDESYLYAAGWLYDSDPDGIRVNSLYRDRWNGDDAFAIYVDAFDDNRSAKWFGVTPAAMRFDALVTEDGQATNDSWDGFWDARTSSTDAGWFVEVRIPFSTLGFQADAFGRATMGLTVTRLVSRTGERVTFPAIDPAFAFRQPSLARDVTLTGVRTSRPLYATPFVVGGASREMVPDGGSGYVADRTRSTEVGVDIRYPLSPTLTLDATANTDFAQVEADDQQINLDRFSLFFPEKRRFFQEGSGVFDFTTGAGSRLFHSRRIGLSDTGEPVPVLGGVRVVGRAGAWDVGALTMQTDDVDAVPSENFATVRLRRRLLNDYSHAGILATSRVRHGAHNVATGIDGTVRLPGDTYLTLKWAGVFDSDVEAPSFGARSHMYAVLARRASRGLGYSLEAIRSGAAYQPELGFLPRRDFWAVNVLANYFVFTDDHRYFRRVWPGMLAFSTFRNGDGTLETGTYAVWIQWETKSGGGGWLEPKLFVEDVLSTFSIGRHVDIPAGRYRYADFQAVWSMPTGRRLRTSVDARAGTFFDGTRAQVIAGPTWNASRHLELGADYQWTRLRFEDRGQADDLHLARIRVRTALDSRASGNAFVQYNSTTDRLDFNVRLRYNFSEGRDLWIVYDEGLATDRSAAPGESSRPRSMSRAFVVKYTHTFGS